MTVVDDVYLVSNSEVQTYKDCPRKWWLAWHRGLKVREVEVNGVRDTGARVHVALAPLHTLGATETPLEALAAAQLVDLEIFSAQERDRVVDDVAVSNTRYQELRSQFELERIMVTGYLEWLEETGADSELETVAAETYVEVDFPIPGVDQPVKLIGKIDARVRDRVTGRHLFIDYKTGDFPNQQLLRIDQQMLHYHLLEQLSASGDNVCDGALYTTLRRVKRTRASKPPYYQRVPVPHNSQQINSYRLQLAGTITRIMKTRSELENHVPHWVAVPPRPSRDCTWKCQFFKTGVCGMLDDGSRAEAAIADLYTIGDPLSYYQGSEEITGVA